MPHQQLQLEVCEGLYTIHRFSQDHQIPTRVFESSFYSVTRTPDELSIVCSSSVPLTSKNAETDWSCLRVLGPLDFSATGVLADLSAVLAKAGISLFAVSTFDTDYLLVKASHLGLAEKALRSSGYFFKNR